MRADRERDALAQAEVGGQLVVQLRQAEAAAAGGLTQSVLGGFDDQILEPARGRQLQHPRQRVWGVQRAELADRDHRPLLLRLAPGEDRGHQGVDHPVVGIARHQLERPALPGIAVEGDPGLRQRQRQTGAVFRGDGSQQLLRQRRQLAFRGGRQVQKDPRRMLGERRKEGQQLRGVVVLHRRGDAFHPGGLGFEGLQRRRLGGTSGRGDQPLRLQTGLQHTGRPRIQPAASQQLDQQGCRRRIGMDQQKVAAGQLQVLGAHRQPAGRGDLLGAQHLCGPGHRLAQGLGAAARQHLAELG
ncbi:hypothetical protein D3C75_687080 [compost metagenome]